MMPTFATVTLAPSAPPAFQRLEALRREQPSAAGRAAFERARRRAAKLWDAFLRSPEEAALPTGGWWGAVVLRIGGVRHGVTADELTPAILRHAVACIAPPDDEAALVFYRAVVHDELVALFEFLARKGLPHARANVRALREEIEAHVDGRLAAMAHAPTVPADCLYGC